MEWRKSEETICVTFAYRGNDAVNVSFGDAKLECLNDPNCAAIASTDCGGDSGYSYCGTTISTDSGTEEYNLENVQGPCVWEPIPGKINRYFN